MKQSLRGQVNSYNLWMVLVVHEIIKIIIKLVYQQITLQQDQSEKFSKEKLSFVRTMSTSPTNRLYFYMFLQIFQKNPT